MIITTKFNEGEMVYVLSNNQIYHRLISSVKWDNKFGVKYDVLDCGIYMEDNVHSSVDDLLSGLRKQYKNKQVNG
jgi:hypothetical protein